jgi:AraC-like DNA-binding protein
MCSLASDQRRKRIAAALRGHAEVLWRAGFADIRETLETTMASVLVVVIDVEDPTGASAQGLASMMRDSFRGIGVVAYVKNGVGNSADLCAMGASGVHDFLIEGKTDEGFLARQIIFDASRRGAADMVADDIRRILPRRLHAFAEAAIKNPSCGTVSGISDYLGVHRQTPNFWCRKERHLHPEELLVWCRLLFAAALLDLTGRTLESIADELDYASPTSLRNQLKKYSGLTATQIREAGFERIVELFRGRIAQLRVGYAGRSDAGPARRKWRAG